VGAAADKQLSQCGIDRCLCDRDAHVDDHGLIPVLKAAIGLGMALGERDDPHWR
jgi:hypothetical protein